MIGKCSILMLTAACLAAAAPSRAQDGPISVTVGAMAISPLSGSARQFTPGLGVDFGVTWNMGEQIGVRFDYAQAALGARDTPQYPASIPLDVEPRTKAVPVQVDPRMNLGTADVVFRAPVQKVRIYVTGGVGVYHRSVSLTVSTPGLISVCNPWWFVCFPGPVTAGQVNATRSTTDLGVNVGAGLATGRFFAEMRYHYVWGPTFSTAAGPVPATGKFLPLVVGARF